jgi:hypothetical protein
MVAALTQVYKETHVCETDTSAEWTVLPTPSKPAPTTSRPSSPPAPLTSRPTTQSKSSLSEKNKKAHKSTSSAKRVADTAAEKGTSRVRWYVESVPRVTQVGSSSTSAQSETRRVARVTPMSHTITVSC